MNIKLFEGFKDEIEQLQKDIRERTSTLDDLDEGFRPVEVFTLNELKKVLALMISSRDAIMVAEREAGDRSVRFAQWRGKIRIALVLKGKFDAFEAPLQKGLVAVDQAEKNFQNAQAELGNFLNQSRPGDYSGGAEHRKWNAKKAELEQRLNEKSAQLRESKTSLAKLRNDRMKAKKEYEDASFTARMTEPRGQRQPETVRAFDAAN